MSELEELRQVLAHEDPEFANAALSIVLADPTELESCLRKNPTLVTAHSKSEHAAMLVHYIAANAIEDELQLSSLSAFNRMRAEPAKREEILNDLLRCLTLLIDSGADIDGLASAYGGGKVQTPLNWLVSSGHPNLAGVLPQITAAFCDAGANVDGLSNDSSPVITAIGFGHPEAAHTLFEHGCKQDNVLLAAASGNIAVLRTLQENDGKFSLRQLTRCETDWFKPPTDPKLAAELALVFAAMCRQNEAIRFLVDSGVDPNAIPDGTHMTGGALHTACLMGHLDTVNLLIELGCDPTIPEPRYKGNAFDWAREGGNFKVIQRVGQFLPEFIRNKLKDDDRIEHLVKAVFADDAAQTRNLLEQNSYSPEELNGPWFYFDSPAVVQAKKNLEIVDALLKAGADINQKSQWWAGGFGVLDETEPTLAEELIKRGAKLDIWSACSLGKIDRVKELIAQDSKVVHRRGPDGKTALHCSKSIGIAQLLIEAGADVNAKCFDHESTAAQYLVAEAPEVTRVLLDAGSQRDIMLASALGDLKLIQEIVAKDSAALSWIVSRDYFPTRAADCIYSWTLGWYLTPHQVANKFKHNACVDWLLTNSPPATTLLNACLLGKSQIMEKLLREQPDIHSHLQHDQQQHVSHAARNSERHQLENLLKSGFSVDARGQHGASALHWAAFHGDCSLAETVLKYEPQLETKDIDYKCTPLQWALEGLRNGWHKDSGDYAGVVRLLLDSGCKSDKSWSRTGNYQIDQMLFN